MIIRIESVTWKGGLGHMDKPGKEVLAILTTKERNRELGQGMKSSDCEIERKHKR